MASAHGHSAPGGTGPQRFWHALAVAGAATLLGGCASTHEQSTAFLRSHETEVATGQYRIQPPDAVVVHAPGADEIDGASAAVRPDGKIVLRLLGEVDVAGLTTAEASAKLQGLLSRYYVEPEVIVEVAQARSQFYYVFGEVAYAGPKPFTGRDTLLKALAEAQPTFLAWRARVHVVRPAAAPGERKIMVVNLDELAKGGDLTQDLLLQAGDVIEVPPTPLAWVGLRVRELLYPVGPVLEAYSTPAAPIAATHVYEDEFGSSADASRRERVLRR